MKRDDKKIIIEEVKQLGVLSHKNGFDSTPANNKKVCEMISIYPLNFQCKLYTAYRKGWAEEDFRFKGLDKFEL